MELIIIIFLFLFATLYYLKKGDSLYKFIIDGANVVYDRYAPYSFKTIREKVKDLGQNYTVKDYTIQICLFGGGALIVSYLYFYNIFALKARQRPQPRPKLRAEAALPPHKSAQALR